MPRFSFGERHDTTLIEAQNLKRAIRMFYVGVPFPHSYSSAPVWTDSPHTKKRVALSSAPDATVLVRCETKTGWEDVARIPPTSPEGETFTPSDLGTLLLEGIPGGETSADGTSIAVASPDHFAHSSRRMLEERTLAAEAAMIALEAQRRELQAQTEQIREELRRRMEQVWLVELFLGSKEEVTTIRQGTPAPVDAKIHVHQRVLCMDEELAVFDWLQDPDRIGRFDCQELEDFDRWLLDPEHLAAVCPHPKAIVAFKVRRYAKERPIRGADVRSQLLDIMQKVGLEHGDAMTYLLIRNGENLYRLWVDVRLWPRFFPRAEDVAVPTGAPSWDVRAAQRRTKVMAAGLLVINGLLQRSTLFHPLPHPKMDAFDPAHVEEYFTLVRDDDGHDLLGDGRDFEHLTWKGYRRWLVSHLAPGVRVFWTGKAEDAERLESRTGLRTVRSWPRRDEPYTLDGGPRPGWGPHCDFLYLPTSGYGQKAHRRVRFMAFTDELIPIDFLSWRVLEHLIRDRGQRDEYGSFFRLAFDWWKLSRAEAEREKPFVDLVLRAAGVDPADDASRARCERLVRWWKIKTQMHRTLAEDEAKAFRMVSAAFVRGDDHTEDPEHDLVHRRG